MFISIRKAIAGILACSALVGTAQADYTFKFTSPMQPIFDFSNQGTLNPSDDALTLVNRLTGGEFILIDDANNATIWSNASMDFSALLSGIQYVTNGVIDTYVIGFDGQFSFTDETSGNLLLTADFTTGFSIAIGITATNQIVNVTPLSANNLPNAMTTLVYTEGPALIPHLNGEMLSGTQDMAFTLTHFSENTLSIAAFPVGNGVIHQISDFQVDSSYTGSSGAVPIPEPTSLLALAATGLLARRRGRRID